VPLKLQLTLVNAAAACAPLGGLAVYLWQCDREGRYSMYSDGVQDQNYLRGVQATAADGSVNFTTVFPGCYPGRMPHLHLEVYRSLDTAGQRAQRLKTSQLALPREACEAVYAGAAGYAASVASLRGLSMAQDGVFSDGVELQMLALRGGMAQGFAAALTLGLSA
jgi:protocatechuate 3,4-dioxygenase beta subunit